MPARPQVLLKQHLVAVARRRGQGLVDLVGGGLDERDHQRVGVTPPAGQVDHPDGLAGYGILDRHPGAGHALEVLGVVLVPEHVGGPARLQRGPDAVGAHDFLGIGEPWRQHDRIQVPFQVTVTGEPEEHEAGRVGEQDADRLALQLLVQVPQHRLGGAGQHRFQVGGAQVIQVEMVGCDSPLLGPPPRREYRFPDEPGIHRFSREEPVPGRGQAITRVVQPRRCTCHLASSTCRSSRRTKHARIHSGLRAVPNISPRLSRTVSS